MNMKDFKILTKNRIHPVKSAKVGVLPKAEQFNWVNQLPKTTGVYLFYENPSESHSTLRVSDPMGSRQEKIIYIGKAINIKNRVKNHFQQPNYKDNLFINKITKISFFETGSEIEALILEAGLIKKYQPKFNVIWKDDKNYFYVAIANEQRPIIYITHQPKKEESGIKHKVSDIQNTQYIGPFVEGTALKKTLRFLRRAFPYYTARKHPKNNCAYCHLGLCPGPNPDLDEYKKNIKKLVLILGGKTTAYGGVPLTAGETVLNSLKKEMKQLSFKKEFEKAAKIRDKISNLQQVISHTRVIESEKINPPAGGGNWNKTEKILNGIVGIKNISRIEAYDISNIQGKQATGVMIVFIKGNPGKSLYRKFKIKIAPKPNDIAMLKETLERRFGHPEWKLPELILIDGGIAQLNIGIKVKNQKTETKKIKVISIAKKYKELFIEGRQKPILLKTLPQEIFNLIINLDDEAHRFAISYHRFLRSKKTMGRNT
ncbi:MAG: GIY-YIG nuclease family protein [Candidatus Staskawiczbacteria bacterium]|nr:GIY-YIG nuclease family protein [Candidatus Staskawiczbacteria bacterium]